MSKNFVKLTVGDKYVNNHGEIHTCKYVSGYVFVLEYDGEEVCYHTYGEEHAFLSPAPKVKRFYTHTTVHNEDTAHPLVKTNASMRPDYRGDGRLIHTSVNELPSHYTTTPQIKPSWVSKAIKAC